jgi:hypothetical protein
MPIRRSKELSEGVLSRRDAIGMDLRRFPGKGIPSMLNQRDTFLKKIRQYMEEIEPGTEVVLFGSRARGSEKDESDWYILILVPFETGLKEE